MKPATSRVPHRPRQSGDFKEVVGISIRTADEQAVVALAKTRNALQHWGLTESAPAVEASAAKVLDFLVRFLDDHLLNELSEKELDAIEGDMTRIRQGLGEIRAYVSERMDRLRNELTSVAERTVKCPDCMQLALVVDGIDNKCHFCSKSWMELLEVPSAYASAVLGYSWYDSDGVGADPIIECPDCETETLVLGAKTASAPDQEVSLCFNCGNVFDDVDSCLKCGGKFVSDGEMTVCPDCFEYAVSRD